MVAGCEVNDHVLKRVADVYAWLDAQIRHCRELAGTCKVCGDCCDFEAFDHRLFITPPELMYLAAHLGPGNIKPMPGGRCPYNIAGQCEVYKYRFAGCRIFGCRRDTDLQSTLSETSLGRFKAICVEFQIPYGYTEIAEALNRLTGT